MRKEGRKTIFEIGDFVTVKEVITGENRQGTIITKGEIICQIRGASGEEYYYWPGTETFCKEKEAMAEAGRRGAEAGRKMKEKCEQYKKHFKKEKNMKIYHATGFGGPNSRNSRTKVYDGYEQFFGHILTIRNDRTHDRFAHLFSPEGTRVHHLDYPTFKAFAEMFPHEYLPLSNQEFRSTKKNLESASVGQLMLFKSIVNRRLSEEVKKDENYDLR